MGVGPVLGVSPCAKGPNSSGWLRDPARGPVLASEHRVPHRVAVRDAGCPGCCAPGEGALSPEAPEVSEALQRPTCSQCRTVKISILGDEGVPVQVDGEAWVQPPGYIRIVHKNRAQTLTRDRVRRPPSQGT